MQQVEDFRKKLKIAASKNGGAFVKADFHIHSPSSTDYEYKSTDSVEKLGRTLHEQGFSYAVILEHQKMPERSLLAELNKYCPNTFLIPGAEINVFVDTLFKKVTKDYFCHCIVAVDPAQSRDYSFILEKAKVDLSYRDTGGYPAGFTSSIGDIGRYFIGEGAIFIPAHLHQSKPPENSRSVDDVYEDETFLDFIRELSFSALEVREKTTATFFVGGKKTLAGLDIPAINCVQSSDAHHHEHILQRQRYTWIKSEILSFDELKAALSFRNRISLVDIDDSHGYIIGLHISGQFIKEEWISLSPSMNCLIGCKGTGKTSVLECLRFVLDTYIPPDRKDNVNKHLQHILGSGGFVECLIKRNDGSKAILVRRADSPQRLRVIEANGTAKDVDNSEQAGFEASIHGWHEIEAVADHPISRINLIDRIGKEAEIKNLYQEIDMKIEDARDHLPLFQRKIKSLYEKLKTRQSLRDKRNTLKKLEEGDLLQLQTNYEQFLTCEQHLTSLRERLLKMKTQIEVTINETFSGLQDELSEVTAYPAEIQEIVENVKALYGKLSEDQSSGIQFFQNGFDRTYAEISEKLEKAKEYFSNFRSSVYDPKVNALPQNEREILSRQIQIIEETKVLPDVESDCRSLETETRKSAATIYDICEGICNARDAICTMRTLEIESINKDISTIQVKFLRSTNHSKMEGYQKKYGQEAVNFLQYIQAFGSPDAYNNLRSMFSIFKSLDVEAIDIMKSIQDLLWDAKFVDFMQVVDDDDIEISLVLQNGTPVPIQNLSAGQRCTAVFPLLLRIKRGPLVIDQPEDNLDNRHIADVIAPQFLEKKQAQQFIITSHNANLVVLTDAELIMHVDSDGSEGKIVNRGFLSCSSSPIKNSVLDVLDGGEAALLARQRKYGINR